MWHSADKDTHRRDVGRQSLPLTFFFLKQNSIPEWRACTHVRACTLHGWLQLLNATRLLGGFRDPPRDAASCLTATAGLQLTHRKWDHRTLPMVASLFFFRIVCFPVVFFLCFRRVLMKIKKHQSCNEISVFEALRYFALDWNDS